MKIKVCGMKYEDNIRELVRLSPEYIGFNFYTRSKRYVGRTFDLKDVSSIPKKIKRVGVFVNSTYGNIMKKVKSFQLDYIQLHGNESAEFCKKLSKSIKIIKAFGVDEKFDFALLEEYQPYCKYFLFDTKTSSYGGSGKVFNWKILNGYNCKLPFFLSGGIGLEEARKISHLPSPISHLFGIDVNSKFEIKPGLKDMDKLKKLKHEIPG